QACLERGCAQSKSHPCKYIQSLFDQFDCARVISFLEQEPTAEARTVALQQGKAVAIRQNLERGQCCFRTGGIAVEKFHPGCNSERHRLTVWNLQFSCECDRGGRFRACLLRISQTP